MSSKGRAAYKLMKKKLGFRYVMDVIPLDATLVKGSHGSISVDEKYHPVIIRDEEGDSKDISPVDVYDILWNTLNKA